MNTESINREKDKCIEILKIKDLKQINKNSIHLYYISLIYEEGGKNEFF